MIHEVIDLITNEFNKVYHYSIDTILPLPLSGSNRLYYRIYFNNTSIIAAYNPDYKENRAFVSFARTFKELNLPVPDILYENLDKNIYFLTDLGDSTLLSCINKNNDGHLSESSLELYRSSIAYLPFFQVLGSKKIDFSVCYPRSAFDIQSMMWDLNYFKYYFARLAGVPFDEQKLEDDFHRLCEFLLKAPANYFLYRDFQSRNIMILQNKPYFIDFQGGRKGSLQYDIASILFEAKTKLHPDDRQVLLNHYLNSLQQVEKIDFQQFMEYFYAFVFIRMMQAMGAYGFRGLFEKKPLFLQSIPNAIEHLMWLRKNVHLPILLPELEKVFDYLVENHQIKELAKKSFPLTIYLTSFSYKKGIPVDTSEHGGGFVFDCRSVNNPGRYPEYQSLTGKDNAVIAFLNNDTRVHIFYSHAFALVSQAIENYTQRNFTYLSVAFGCTGGQHRSVYFTERMAADIRRMYPTVQVEILHRELN